MNKKEEQKQRGSVCLDKDRKIQILALFFLIVIQACS